MHSSAGQRRRHRTGYEMLAVSKALCSRLGDKKYIHITFSYSKEEFSGGQNTGREILEENQVFSARKMNEPQRQSLNYF